MPVELKSRQYRNFQKKIRALTDEEDKFIVEGYATTFDDPYLLYSDSDIEIYETVSRDAFTDVNLEDVIFQYDHEGRVYARTSNDTLKLEVDEKGLKVIADLGGTEIGRNLYEEIKGGYTTKMSWGFSLDHEMDVERFRSYDKDKDKTIVKQNIKGIRKIYDVSAVSLPANDATEISARNFSMGVIEELKAERLKERLNLEKSKLKLMLNMEG